MNLEQTFLSDGISELFSSFFMQFIFNFQKWNIFMFSLVVAESCSKFAQREVKHRKGQAMRNKTKSSATELELKRACWGTWEHTGINYVNDSTALKSLSFARKR